MTQPTIEIDDAVVYATPSKEKAQEMIDRLKNAVEEGTQDPLQLLVKLRFAQRVIEESITGIEKHCVDEASKYARGERVTLLGAELSVKETGTKWNYENCNDPVYRDLTEKSGAMKDMIKGREAFLKSLKESMTIVDDTTGEVVMVAPPMKTSKTIVEVKFK